MQRRSGADLPTFVATVWWSFGNASAEPTMQRRSGGRPPYLCRDRLVEFWYAPMPRPADEPMQRRSGGRPAFVATVWWSFGRAACPFVPPPSRCANAAEVWGQTSLPCRDRLVEFWSGGMPPCLSPAANAAEVWGQTSPYLVATVWWSFGRAACPHASSPADVPMQRRSGGRPPYLCRDRLVEFWSGGMPPYSAQPMCQCSGGLGADLPYLCSARLVEFW